MMTSLKRPLPVHLPQLRQTHLPDVVPPHPSSPTFSRVRAQGWDVPVCIFHFRDCRHTPVCILPACVMLMTWWILWRSPQMLDSRAWATMQFILSCLDYPVPLSAPVQHAQLLRVPVCAHSHVLSMRSPGFGWSTSIPLCACQTLRPLSPMSGSQVPKCMWQQKEGYSRRMVQPSTLETSFVSSALGRFLLLLPLLTPSLHSRPTPAQTQRDRISRGPLASAQALPIATFGISDTRAVCFSGTVRFDADTSYRNVVDEAGYSVSAASLELASPGSRMFPCVTWGGCLSRRRPAGSGPRRLIGGASGGGQRTLSAHLMWDLWRRIGNKAYLADPVASALKCVHAVSRGLSCVGASAPFAPIVFQENEIPPPQYEVARPDPLPPPDPDSPAAHPADHGSDSHSFLPELPRLKVVVVPFQGPTCYHSLWYEEGEGPKTLMLRANLLLQDDPSFVTLVPADPQPDAECLTLLLFPVWLRLVGIRRFLLKPPLPTQHAFVQGFALLRPRGVFLA